MSVPNLSQNPTNTPPFSVAPKSTQESGRAFQDRRQPVKGEGSQSGERRQFGSAHLGLTQEGRELALAIDRYKLENHRRYITCDEMLQVITSLGYSKSST